MLFTAPGRRRLHQRRHPVRRDDPPDGRRRHASSSQVLEDQGIIPGIKVDAGAKPLAVRRRRDRHRRPRRAARATRRVLRARRALREVARDVHRQREPAERLLHRRQRARARALRGAVPGSRHRADRRARSADGRRAHHRAVVDRDALRVLEATFHTLVHQHVDARGHAAQAEHGAVGVQLPGAGVGRRRRGARPCGASSGRCPPRCPASCSCRAVSPTSSATARLDAMNRWARTRGS